jgi:hypothetical protein
MSFLSSFFSNSPRAQTKRPTKAYYTPEDVASVKDVICGDYNIKKFIWEAMLQTSSF